MCFEVSGGEHDRRKLISGGQRDGVGNKKAQAVDCGVGEGKISLTRGTLNGLSDGSGGIAQICIEGIYLIIQLIGSSLPLSQEKVESNEVIWLLASISCLEPSVPKSG